VHIKLHELMHKSKLVTVRSWRYTLGWRHSPNHS